MKQVSSLNWKKNCRVADFKMTSASLGRSNDLLDKIDLSVPLDSAIQILALFHCNRNCLAPQRQCISTTYVQCIIDGHHDSLKMQSCPIPELSSCFTRYNTPVVSKHVYKTYYHSPCKLCQGFRSKVETLVRSITDYTEYLVVQNKMMKSLHACETHFRQISDVLCVKYVHVIVKVLLLKLFERLELKGKKFEGFNPASSSDINEVWAKLQDIDSKKSPNVSR